MLEEDVARGLRGVDPDAVVGDYGRGGRGDLELFFFYGFFLFSGFFCFFKVEKEDEKKKESKTKNRLSALFSLPPRRHT